MNKLGKIAPIVVILACVGSLVLAFMVAKKKAEHLAQIASLTNERDSLTTEINKTKKTLKQTQGDLTTTSNNLVQTTATLTTTKAALDQKTQEATSLETQLTDATNQLTQTKADLAEKAATIKNIQDGLTSVGITNINNIAELRDRIVSMGEENGVLGKQLTVLHAENERLKARVEELSTTPVGLRGHVSVVDGKWGFIVMDIGHSQRVQPDSEFLVYRNSKFVGKVQVTSVAANDCVGQILPDYLKHPPQPGDLVIH
jgi:predicted nuclease with TOPRIM domain